MSNKAVSLRKVKKIKRLNASLSETLSLLAKLSSKAPTLHPFLLYWKGVAYAGRGSDAKAVSYFEQSISESSAPGGGSTSYPATLSMAKLAELQDTLSKEDISSELLTRLQQAGDLRSLAVLNEKEVRGAAEAVS